MNERYDGLKLDNQICFPLYAASKEVIKKYRPFLNRLDLTYTQYIVMMVMWEHRHINVKDLGAELFLDSGTLTPLLKSLEVKGLVTRERNKNDERVLNVSITNKGIALQENALSIPKSVVGSLNLDKKEVIELYRILYKILLPTEQQ